MLEKFGVTQEEFLALFGFPGGKEEPRPEPEPAPESAPPSSGEGWGFAAPLEQAIPVEQALLGRPAPKPAPAPKPIPRPAPVPKPAPERAPVPVEQALLPEWMDPSWLPSESEEPEFTEEELAQLPHLKLVEFPPSKKPAKPEPKPSAIPELEIPPAARPKPEPSPEPPPALDTVNGAAKYLLSLENTHDEFKLVADAIRGTTKTLASKRTPKVTANDLGFAIGTLESMLQKPGLLGRNKTNIEKAANTLINYYSEKVDKLPADYQERVNRQVIRQVEGPKKRPLQRRSSQWHGENVIYTRNRAIDIMRNEEDVSAESAEEQAQDEWNRIIEIIDKEATAFGDEDKKNLRILFGKKILGSGSFDQSEQEIRDLINRGPEDYDDFYKDVNPDALDTTEALQVLTSRAAITEEIEDLPEEYVKKLTPKIAEFGNLAQQLLKIGEDLEPMLETRGKLPEEALLKIQHLYNKAVSLSISISNTPTEVKTKAFNDGEIFKTIFALSSKIADYTETFGIEELESTEPITGLELAEADLRIFDPTKKKAPVGGKPRKRSKEVEDAARETYMNLIRYMGRLEDFYKKKRDYHLGPTKKTTTEGDIYQETNEEFVRRRNLKKENDRVRTTDIKQIMREVNLWKSLAFKRAENIDAEIQKAINIHQAADRSLFQRLAQSWLDVGTISQIENERLNDRINKLTDTLDYIKKFPRQTNFFVTQALENHVNNIRNMWEEAKASAPVLSEEEKFKPGIWTQEQLSSRKVSKVVNMIDFFTKCAVLN